MKTAQNTSKYFVNFDPKKIATASKQKKNLTFFELASQSISKTKKGTYTTASRDVDEIAYGVK